MALGSFFPSVTGMDAYSNAISTVSTNIANISTVGYKKSETMFYTLLGSQPIVKQSSAGISSSRADIQGVGYYVRNLIDDQGLISATGQNFDVAINSTGNAFFMIEQNGNTYYSRAGDFSTRTSDGKTYLISSSGGKVLGFPASGANDGTFGASPSEIVLMSPETMPSTPTTKMKITGNVSSSIDKNSFGLTVYGPNNDGRNMTMIMNKVEDAANTWDVSFALEDGTIAQTFEAVFDGNGALVTPKTFDLSVQWADNSSQTLHMDITNLTQFSGSNELTAVDQNGSPSGSYIKTYIDSNGVVQSTYTNGKTFEIAKLAIVGFESPDNLYPISNTLFEAYPDAGPSYYLQEKGIISPGSLEQSTANIEEQFGKMLVIQRAYSLNTQAFTVNDEMLEQLINLKA